MGSGAVSKPTKAEHRNRIKQVRNLLATGTPRPDILQYAHDKWSICDATVDDYIALASAEIQASAASSREDDVANARAVYETIMREQIGRGDLRGAASTMDKLCRLFGLDAPTRVEQSGITEVVVHYADSNEDRPHSR